MPQTDTQRLHGYDPAEQLVKHGNLVWDVDLLQWVRMEQPVIDAGDVTVDAVKIKDPGGTLVGNAGSPLRVDPTGATTQPVSAASLPLPTGAATEASAAAVVTSLGTDGPAPPALDGTGVRGWLRGLWDLLTGIKTGTDRIPTSPSQDRTTAAAPSSARLSDGAAFYDAAKSSQLPGSLVGGRLDVSVGAALPAGTNNIGDVDVASLPPGSVAAAAAKVLDLDTGAGTDDVPVFGIALPKAGGAVAGGTASDPVRVDPTGTTTQPVGDGGGSITVDAPASSPVPVSVTATDNTVVKPGDAGNNAIRVNVVAGAAGGVSHQDDTAFAPGTGSGVPAFGVFDDVAPDSVDEGDAGALRMSANRSLHVQLRDGDGGERGAHIHRTGDAVPTLPNRLFTEDLGLVPKTASFFYTGTGSSKVLDYVETVLPGVSKKRVDQYSYDVDGDLESITSTIVDV